MSNKVLNLIILVGFVNFFSFVLISVMIGGDALNGHAAGGHYYLASHGKLTEVGQGLFAYSKWHALSLFVTHPLAIIAMAIRAAREKRKRRQARVTRT